MEGSHRTPLMLSAISAHPLGSLGVQSIGFLLGLPNTASHNLLETSQALANHLNADGTRVLFFLRGTCHKSLLKT